MSAATATRAQAWIELKTDDPEALSALAVARARLPEARALASLRRFRLFELEGPLPARAALEERLHRSTWFYNPHKERCTLRLAEADPTPLRKDERPVLVVERGGERRPAAERWWRHESAEEIRVEEAIVWALRFEAGEPRDAEVAALARLEGPAHGLLCNPNSQRWAAIEGSPPLDWIRRTEPESPASKGMP
jgi:hypothetical protein